MPANGMVCSPVTKSFIGRLDKEEIGECKKLGKEDEEIWSAMTAITEAWP